MPKSVPQALKIDKKNQNALWKDGIEQETCNIMTAFQFMEDSENFPIDYQHIKLHMVFDVEKDFTQKDSLFSVGHRWELPGNYPVSAVVMVIYNCVDIIGEL